MIDMILVLVLIAAGTFAWAARQHADAEVRSFERRTPEPPRLHLIYGGQHPYDWADEETEIHHRFPRSLP